MADPFDDLYDGSEPERAKQRPCLVVGAPMSRKAFAEKFVGKNVECQDPIFEVVKSDGSVTILDPGEPTPKSELTW